MRVDDLLSRAHELQVAGKSDESLLKLDEAIAKVNEHINSKILRGRAIRGLQAIFKYQNEHKMFTLMSKIVKPLITEVRAGHPDRLVRLMKKRGYTDSSFLVNFINEHKDKDEIIERLITGRLYQTSGEASDMIIISKDKRILLINRGLYPFGFAIPGGFIDESEKPEDAAWRELKEETKLTKENIDNELILKLTKVKVSKNPRFARKAIDRRDPRGDVVSHAFVAIVNRNYDVPTMKVKGDDDATGAGWFPIKPIKNYDGPIVEQLIKDSNINQEEKDRLILENCTLNKSKNKMGVLDGKGSDILAFDHAKILRAVLDHKDVKDFLNK